MKSAMLEKPAMSNQALEEKGPEYRAAQEMSSPSMLDDSLSMSVWERIQANDDMVNFGVMLRTAMEKRNAEPR